MSVTLRPTLPSDRIPSLDFLRGIAVLGILVINIESFTYPDPWSPFKYGFASEVDHTVRFWVYFMAQGKFYSMFTLLFGVGFFMFLERLEKKGTGLQAMDLYARRLLWLFLIGVAHAYLIWDGDVLYHYATCGFLLFPFRSFSVKQLLLVLMVPIGVILYNSWQNTSSLRLQLTNYEVAMTVSESERTPDQVAAIEKWESRIAIGAPDQSAITSPRMTYGESVALNADHSKVHRGQIMYPGLFFRTLIMMILGMILYRTGVFSDFRALPYYWLLTAGLLVLALTTNYVRYFHWTYQYFEPVTNPVTGWFVSFPKELSGLSYILLLNGLYQLLAPYLSFNWIRSAGRMALTNYILQSVICGVIFYGFAFNMYNGYSRSGLLVIVLSIWIAQLVFSHFWLRKYSQGPLENFWRRMTYWPYNKSKDLN